jgi:hypothetical protein
MPSRGSLRAMAKKADRSAGTPATALLTTAQVEFTLHPYDVSPAAPNYGALVAGALGVAPESVFKTLVAEVDGALTVAVVPVTGDLDLKALAAAAGGKRAALADRAAAERSSGYVRGRNQSARPAPYTAHGHRRLRPRPRADVRIRWAPRVAGVIGAGRSGPSHQRRYGIDSDIEYQSVAPDRTVTTPLRPRRDLSPAIRQVRASE